MTFNTFDLVLTASSLEAKDFTAEGRLKRKPNQIGTIVEHSDSHGLCYHVKYEAGGSGWFDPDELILIAKADETNE